MGGFHQVDANGIVTPARPIDTTLGTTTEAISTASQDRNPYLLGRLAGGSTVIVRVVL